MIPEHFGLYSIFYLLCGLSLFLYGMKLAERGMQKTSGRKLRRILSMLTRNRVSGALAGIGLTFLTQSSSATSVMLVGLVSAGLMTLQQSVSILLGSAVGTSFTVQLYSFQFYRLAPLLIAVGFYFYAFSRSVLRKRLGQIVMSFGLIFFGMRMMSEAAYPLKDHVLFQQILRSGTSGVALSLLLATVFTALFQSSAATIAMVLTFSMPGPGGHSVIGLEQAIPLVLGANIGTCATALLASIRQNDDGRRVAWAHVLFHIAGVLVFLPFLRPFAALCGLTAVTVSQQIANAHTLFNLTMTVLFLPACGLFVKLVMKVVPDSGGEGEEYAVRFIDKKVFNLPALALGQAVREINHMSGIVTMMAEKVIPVFKENEPGLRDEILKADDEVDFLHESIVLYLSRLSEEELTADQSNQQIQLIQITGELERAADVVSKNLMRHAKKKIKTGYLFSEEGWQEIKDFYEKNLLCLQSAVNAFAMGDMAMAQGARQCKLDLDQEFESLRTSHLNRLNRGLSATLETATIHLDLLDDIHLLNEHAFRIASLVLKNPGENGAGPNVSPARNTPGKASG